MLHIVTTTVKVISLENNKAKEKMNLFILEIGDFTINSLTIVFGITLTPEKP